MVKLSTMMQYLPPKRLVFLLIPLSWLFFALQFGSLGYSYTTVDCGDINGCIKLPVGIGWNYIAFQTVQIGKVIGWLWSHVMIVTLYTLEWKKTQFVDENTENGLDRQYVLVKDH